MEFDADEQQEGMLGDVGFMFDACLEKVTCRYDYGADVSVLLTYAQDEPGALQVGRARRCQLNIQVV